jgi:FkbM family methyltransferase
MKKLSKLLNNLFRKIRWQTRNIKNGRFPFSLPFWRKLSKQVQKSKGDRFVDNHYTFYYLDDLEEFEKDTSWSKERVSTSSKELLKEKNRLINELISKSYLYDKLSDTFSRELLVKIATFAILGHRHVRMPCWDRDHKKNRDDLIKTLNRPQFASPEFSEVLGEIYPKFPYKLYDISFLGGEYCYTSADNLVDFKRDCYQYCYRMKQPPIGIMPGDIVIDCGAALGDISIFFAILAKSSGHVYSFEPNPKFCKMFKENIRLNANLLGRISLIEKAVGDNDGQKVKFKLDGAGSKMEQTGEILVATQSIDNLCAEYSIPRVNFIKMDIEGSELAALRGAEKTIRQHKPRLAICLYHKPEDFYDIPFFISSLNLGYSFYLDHHAVNEWETVLYAESKE